MNGGILKFIFSTERDAEWSRRNLQPPYSKSAPR